MLGGGVDSILRTQIFDESQAHISGSLNILTLYFQTQTATFVCLHVHSTAISNLLLNPSNECIISVIVLCSSRISIRL